MKQAKYKIWLFTFITILVGFMPYKFPKNPDNITANQILIEGGASTCTPTWSVKKGKLVIPRHLEASFGGKCFELEIDASSETTPHELEPYSNTSILGNEFFIISGSVVGVDSTYFKQKCGNNFALFKVDDWSPTIYNARFWTFNKYAFILYFILFFANILMCIDTLIAKKSKNNF